METLVKQKFNIVFNESEIAKLFPFYFSMDENLNIISAGDSIKKLAPTIINSQFEKYFSFKRPFSISYNFKSILEYTNQVIVIITNELPQITLRGQLIVIEEKQLVFLGSPWLTSADDFPKFNLNISDFAIHDATTDMLQLIKRKEIMSKDMLLLVEDLKRQKKELQNSEEELKFSNKRFSALIQNMQSGILLESSERKIVLANKTFCDIFGIPVSPEQLIGNDCENSARDSKAYFANSENFIERIETILHEKKLVQNEELEMTNGTFLERDFVPIFSDNEYNGHLWIYKDITQRKKNENELVFAKEQAILEKISKEQFLANMSHELRNPINIIIGITELIHDTNLSEKQDEYLGIIKTASENLLSLVNDILDFEKIQAKKIKLHNLPFDIRKCVIEVYQSMKYLAENKNLKLNIHIDNFLTTHHVSGDPLRLKQILFNLVNNAIKFTEKGTIDIFVSMSTNSGSVKQITFEVKDTGIGISKEDISNIYDRYVQVKSESDNYTAGTGLGLTIVKNLVELQNGTITVTSQKGIGSSFTVNIPYEIIEHLEIEKDNIQQKKIDLSNRKILIVEDDKFNQLITNLILKKHGATTDTADNGEIAIEMLRNNKYDLVLLDLQMPVLNGYKTAEIIRNKIEGTNSFVPIIALTANILSGEKEKCLSIGMNDYLSKPFKENDLIEKVDLLMTRPNKNESKLVDLLYLKSIAPENNNFYEQLITEFLFQTPLLMDEMKKSVQTKNWKNVEETAHRLKGRISFIGSPYFIKSIAEIELNCQKRQHLNMLPAMLDSLDTNCNKAYAELRLELKNTPL